MIALRQEPVADLRAHAAIPNSFEADVVCDVVPVHGGFELTERRLAQRMRKDYDQLEDPLSWPRDFDTRNWVLVAAFAGAERVGGILVAAHTPGVDLLEQRSDLAVLWDVRVAPAWRRTGVATEMLRAAQLWALQRGCTQLKVETQNTNVAACRFYQRSGFVLSAARPGAYEKAPGEVQLIWRKPLTG